MKNTYLEKIVTCHKYEKIYRLCHYKTMQGHKLGLSQTLMILIYFIAITKSKCLVVKDMIKNIFPWSYGASKFLSVFGPESKLANLTWK